MFRPDMTLILILTQYVGRTQFWYSCQRKTGRAKQTRIDCWARKGRRKDLKPSTVSIETVLSSMLVQSTIHHYHHHHLSLNREGRWGTTDDFATSFLHFSPFSTALWDLQNSSFVHSLSALSSSPFHCALQDGFGQVIYGVPTGVYIETAKAYMKSLSFQRMSVFYRGGII